MKAWFRMGCAAVLSLSLLTLTACVTETTTDGKPKAEEKSTDEVVANYVQLAKGYLQRGDREKAMRAINKGLEIDSDSPEMLNVLAFYYNSDGEKELAEKQFRHAISSHSEHTPSYLNYGAFLYEQKRYDEACKNFEKAASDVNYVGRAAAFSNLGSCLKQKGKVKEAEEAFNRSLGHDFRNPRALIEMSALRFEQGEFQESRRLYEEYLKYGKQTPRTLWLGIRLMHVFGEDDRKASMALFLKNEYPSSPEYQEYKAWAEKR